MKEPMPANVKTFMVAGGMLKTPTRMLVDRKSNRVTWIQGDGDGSVPVLSAAAGRIEDSEPALRQHSTLFDDKYVQISLTRKLRPDMGVPLQGVLTTALTRGGKTIDVGSIDFQKSEPYCEVGQRGSARLVLVDPKTKAIRDVQINAWLQDRDGRRVELAVVEDEAGYLVNYTAPKSPGAFRVLINVAGLGLYEEYFVAMPTQ